MEKMKQLYGNPLITKWYYSFLTARTQCVKVNGCISQLKSSGTGVPQGCVSSPILFTLFTNECSNWHSQNYVFKYSDDTAILSLLYEHDNVSIIYQAEISVFVGCCDKNELVINTKKTQEIVFDPKCIGDHQPVIHNHYITQSQTYTLLKNKRKGSLASPKV